jgi:CRISPR/Cas system-associated exonuclease Cas4 (RecB family)
MTLTVSWSQLRLFEECRQKVTLLRAGKRKSGADARVFFPGTVVDRVVRDWLLTKPGDSDLGQMPDMVDEIMEREERLLTEDEDRIVRWKDASDKAKVRADCVEAVTKIEPALVRYVLPYEYQVDYRFRTALDVPYHDEMVRILLIGAMDITVHNPVADWWMNLDVKMTRDNQYWKKTQGQLTFYDLQTELEHGKPTKATALLQPLCTQQVKPIPMTAQGRQEMLAHISTFVTAILDNDMPVTKKPSQCIYCDFKHACPKFAPVLDDRGKKTIAY